MRITWRNGIGERRIILGFRESLQNIPKGRRENVNDGDEEEDDDG